MRADRNSNIPAGTQTLVRGMTIVEAVARGAATLKDIGVAIGCTCSTTHRLIQSLVQAGFLCRDTKIGYGLGRIWPRSKTRRAWHPCARPVAPAFCSPAALEHLSSEDAGNCKHQRRARAGNPVSRKDRRSACKQDAVKGWLQDAACADSHGEGVVA